MLDIACAMYSKQPVVAFILLKQLMKILSKKIQPVCYPVAAARAFAINFIGHGKRRARS